MDRKTERELQERQYDVLSAFRKLLHCLPEDSLEYDALEVIVNILAQPFSGRKTNSIDHAFENQHFNFMDEKPLHDALVQLLKAMDV